MGTVDLATLRSRVRERADMVNSSFVTDTSPSLDAWINEGIGELYERLVDALGEEYQLTETSFTTSSVDTALPADFYKLYLVEADVQGQRLVLDRYNVIEQSGLRSLPNSTLYGPRYFLSGSNLRILPQPSNLTVYLSYAPAATELVNGTDTVTVPASWERYVVLYAAKQALMKEESSVTEIDKELTKLERQIDERKEARDLARPHSVVDLDAYNMQVL